ncbi:hypothetical protein O181_025346 [Austropuccinia psidii MF-1]|uniref:Uncharacterized protein n=1 Tax=Austropuccinia psidii MF-1 TaxID=1389203 RepID=A0A9Q3CN87_9BASI|nr:hypothetical protein [Austropuccinia psidii MF-1]
MRDSFVEPFTIIRLLRNHAVEVRLTEGFSRKHPVFPISLVKPYNQTDDKRFPENKKIFTYVTLVEEDDSLETVKKITKSRKIRINGKDKRQYLVSFKMNQKKKINGYLRKKSQRDKLTSKDSETPIGQETLINDEPLFEGGYVIL